MALNQPVHEVADVAVRFTGHRSKLYAIAYRTLGSPWRADDAVQETWIRLQRADIVAIDNLEAWLTTVIGRVCIDMIRQQESRREDLGNLPGSGDSTSADPSADPSDTAMANEELSVAMQIVLDTLGPLERLAFVLHDVFALSFDDIAPIVERTPATARQLASRARARLRRVDADRIRRRRDLAIEAFLDAARRGDFGGLLQLLDPEIELRSDDAAVDLAAAGADHGAPLLEHRVRGADAVARVFAGRAELTRPGVVLGVPAAAYVDDGTIRAVYVITFDNGRIRRLDVLADPNRIAALDPAVRC